MAYEGVLELALRLPPADRLRLANVLRGAAEVKLALAWSDLVAFEQARSLPSEPGVYAILFDVPAGIQMVRIGATRDGSARPADYRRAPFVLEPRLRVAFCAVPAAFRENIGALLNAGFPQHLVDLDWLEYRMERCLLDAYERRSKKKMLPPGNFQRGSRRRYLDHVVIEEGPGLRVLDLAPAELPEAVLDGLRQSRR